MTDEKQITHVINTHVSLMQKKGFVGPHTARSIKNEKMVRETMKKLQNRTLVSS